MRRKNERRTPSNQVIKELFTATTTTKNKKQKRKMIKNKNKKQSAPLAFSPLLPPPRFARLDHYSTVVSIQSDPIRFRFRLTLRTRPSIFPYKKPVKRIRKSRPARATNGSTDRFDTHGLLLAAAGFFCF